MTDNDDIKNILQNINNAITKLDSWNTYSKIRYVSLLENEMQIEFDKTNRRANIFYNDITQEYYDRSYDKLYSKEEKDQIIFDTEPPKRFYRLQTLQNKVEEIHNQFYLEIINNIDSIDIEKQLKIISDLIYEVERELKNK